MKRKFTLVLSMLLTLALQISTSPANAGAGCVNSKEFSKAKTGMSVKAVAKIFGTNGSVMSKTEGFGSVVIIRQYKACTTFGVVTIMFTDNKLDTKSAIF
jgi:hypothetical protein